MDRLALLSVLATGGVAACTSGPSDLDAAPLVQVDEVTSTSGTYSVALLAHGASPTRGLHVMELVVSRPVDGAMVDGLTLEIVPWMPAMGHGTSLTPMVTAMGSGVYEVADLDLYMAGIWQLRTTLGTPPDAATPVLQIQ
jgi:hypothetical protein